MKKNNNQKTWKKSHRQRYNRKSYIVKIKFDLEEYEKINACRISLGLSWNKFVSRAIKNALENFNE